MSESYYYPENYKPLPKESDYLEAIATVVEEYGIEDASSLSTALLYNIRSTPGFRNFHIRALHLSRSVAPQSGESSTSIDAPQPRSAVFYSGLGFGGLLLPHLYGDTLEMRSIFEQGSSTVSDGELGIGVHSDVVDTLLEIAAGEITNPVDSALEVLEERVVPNVPSQRYFRVGCGVLMAYAHQSYENQLQYKQQSLLDEMKKELATNTEHDWDAALETWRVDG